ncbi:MAG: FAD-dependent oxidoreductase [Planctomycetota bacterium]
MKIAIIGGGISGLTAGFRLHESHEVSLFEANNYIGGHTNTIDVPTPNGAVAVDTGFIVFNDRTYPNFIAMIESLGVAYQPTRMSFSVSCERTGLEYAGTNFNGLFAQRRNLFRPWFYRLLLDFGKFKKLAESLLEKDAPAETVESFLTRHQFSSQFIEQYFLPMGAAIWSSSFDSFRQFPIQFIAEFYKNHGLLGIRDRPQWYVIEGGSKQYIEPLTRAWSDRIQLATPIRRVTRFDDHVIVDTVDGRRETFDHVIFACHSDQALKILGDDASLLERQVLSAFPYQPNQAILHTDTKLLPKTKRAWACWNYFNPAGESDAATLTYNMNMLQSLDTSQVYCVTLNDNGNIDPAKIIGEFQYSHPTFGIDRNAMQQRHAELIGHRSTSFCGAYWGNGFHEDGVKSAIAVTELIQELSGAKV